MCTQQIYRPGKYPCLLTCLMVAMGEAVGASVQAFDEDYKEDLESSIADIKQCTMEGGADHTIGRPFSL